MRLLYVIDSLAPGGAELSLAEMAPELVDQGIDLHVLPLGRRLDLKERLLSAGTTVHTGPTKLGRFRSVRRIMHLSSQLNPDLIHTTLYEANQAGRVAARGKGIPCSTSFVGDTYGRSPLRGVARLKLASARVMDRATARFAASFHAVSGSLASSYVEHLKIPASRIHVIPRGRDAKRFPFRSSTVRSEVRAELGIGNETPMVLAVGRLEPVKGLKYLLQGLPELAVVAPEAHVVIAGKDGMAGADLRASATRSPLPVSFLGHRPDIGRLMGAADVLAFPSLSEGSPGTLIEAMATGCPIVASNIEPNVEVLGGTGSAGLTVPVGDANLLARSIGSILTRTVDVSGMTTEARKRFERNFEIRAVARRMEDFFRGAAGGVLRVE